MEAQLTVPAILRRAETFFGSSSIVSRRPDKSLHRYRYAEMIDRAKRLAVQLRDLGVSPGDRVATLAWNHYRHLEAYFAITAIGAVLHTLNLRLHSNDLAYIINHADDRVLILDESLLPLFEPCRERVNVQHVIVIGGSHSHIDGCIDFEELISTADPRRFAYVDLEEHEAGRCATPPARRECRKVRSTHIGRSPSSLLTGSLPILSVSGSATSFCQSCRCSIFKPGVFHLPR